MKIKTKFKFIFIFTLFTIVFVALGAIVGVGSYVLLRSQLGVAHPVPVADNLFGWKYSTGEYPVAAFPLAGSGHLAYSDIRDPGGIPEGLPVRLQIPIIGVDSAIEDAYITPEGRMDVPAGSVNVAWFALGPQPGKVGSAVIGGHFGMRNGVPFVFYDLDKLRIGDRVYIVNDENDRLQFIVRSIKLFDRKDDATEVFTSHDGLAHLNLITCEGVWNEINGFYPKRRVVFTELVSSVAADTSSLSTFSRVLSVGAEGADVTALQEILEEKGFLKLPTGTEKGYFDEITSSALARYQKSVGLESVGIFGPMTRAKIIADVTNISVPDVGIDSVRTEKTDKVIPAIPPSRQESSFTIFEKLIQTGKNLFATSINTFVTSSLFAAIGFMAFKILREQRLASLLERKKLSLLSHEKKEHEHRNAK